MSEKRKLNVLTVEFKRKVIKSVEENPSKKKTDIAKEFNIPSTTLHTILKNKDKYGVGKGIGKMCKRAKNGKFQDVDECVVIWLKQCRDKNLPISGPILQEKAQEFAGSLGLENFRASNGWLHNFKRRYDIVLKKGCGEGASVDDSVCDDWKAQIEEQVAVYKPEDVYNADETGLLYKYLQDKTLPFKADSCHAGKHSNSGRCIYNDQLEFTRNINLSKMTDDTCVSENGNRLGEAASEDDVKQEDNGVGYEEENREGYQSGLEDSDTNHQPSTCTQIKGTSETTETSKEAYEFEESTLNIMEKPNRHIAFMQSLLPSLENLDDDDVIEFQIGVLNLIKNIKNSKNPPHHVSSMCHDPSCQMPKSVNPPAIQHHDFGSHNFNVSHFCENVSFNTPHPLAPNKLYFISQSKGSHTSPPSVSPSTSTRPQSSFTADIG